MAGLASLIPPETEKTKGDEKVDYFNLPCPIPYEEIHREALSQSLFLCSSLILICIFFFLGICCFAK